MTPREASIGLATFALLTAALAVNLLAMQGPVPMGKARGERSQATAAEKAEKARRLSLGAPQAGQDRRAEPREADGGEAVRAIQRELQARGYETGGLDGTPGLVTRAAIMAFEHDHGLPLSGEADETTLKRILLGASAAGDAAAEQRRASAEAVIRTVQQTLSGLGYNTGKVDGKLGEDTQRAIRDFEIDHQLPETGRVSGSLIARLAKAAGGGRLPGSR